MPMVMPQCTQRLAALTPIQTLTVKVSERVLSCNTEKGLPFLHDIWSDDCDQQPHPPYKKILIVQRHQCTGQGCVICEALEISQMFKFEVSIYLIFKSQGEQLS